MRVHKDILESLYQKYNRREYAHPDPVEFLHHYPDGRDKEIVGFIASALAYGRVKQILKSVSIVLERMGSPYRFLRETPVKEIRRTFRDFKHRFTTAEELGDLLDALKTVLNTHGSLCACFLEGFNDRDQTVHPALVRFTEAIRARFSTPQNSLVPEPQLGSACKRLHLFLRWMVRRDEIDVGLWEVIPPSKLIIPMDTHMHRIGCALRLTKRKQADLRAALDVTRSFKRLSPSDPVRYDFALTRLGIRDDADLDGFLDVQGDGKSTR